MTPIVRNGDWLTRTRLLKPLIPLVVDTLGTKTVERKRAWMATTTSATAWHPIPYAPETWRTALRTLVVMIERQWRAEGWSCAETSGQVPLDELNARNEARRLLGEPYEEEGR